VNEHATTIQTGTSALREWLGLIVAALVVLIWAGAMILLAVSLAAPVPHSEAPSNQRFADRSGGFP
jgi:hypothetical protein